MARNSQISTENGFIRGLISEATGLNFPDKAATDTLDCTFEQTGVVSRRLGMNYESGYSTASATRNSSVIREYIWEAVAGTGTTSFVVVQVGNIIHFYEVGSDATLSTRKKSFTIDLTTKKVATVTDATVRGNFCQFASGFGQLFIVHPYCEPFYVEYTPDTDSITSNTINITIRDFKGVEDTLAVDYRPKTLSVLHKYNLFNQGWYVNSVSSVNFGSGDDNPLVCWDTGRSDFPSNADVWWLYRDSSNDFNKNWINKFDPGTTPAPKGHYVLNVFNQRRGKSAISTSSAATGVVTVTTAEPHMLVTGTTVTIENCNIAGYNNTFTVTGTPAKDQFTFSSATTGTSTTGDVYPAALTTTSSGTSRPSAVAFYAGRVFYSGVNAHEYNNFVYFTKILEDDKDYGYCQQVNDPTSADNSDLLPSDGGYVNIPEMGNCIRMVPVGTDLLIFASNGIWAISGGKGLSFTANDYAVRRLSTIPAISPTSFVIVDGFPMFWNNNGIYIAKPDQMGELSVQSITDQTILTFFNNIPAESKYYAKAVFDPNKRIVSWIYRSTTASSADNKFDYDRVLNLNMLTGAFYPYSIQQSSGYPTVNGVCVISYAGNYAPTVKFFTTKLTSGTTYTSTWSQFRATTYKDWDVTGTGLDYTSYVNTGFKVIGGAVTKTQQNYVVVYCKADSNASLNLRGKWDFSNNSNSNLWTANQEVYIHQSNKDYLSRRIKIRGQGRACQLAFTSTTGKPFYLIGWGVAESGNTQP
jgi:hypothetical protein